MSKAQLYPVAEVFGAIQGEGRFVGRQVVFIRLAGCNQACEFCDTDHTPKLGYLTPERIAVLTSQIYPLAGSRDVPLVLTGGEPTVHNLRPLLDVLDGPVHLETNGTNPIPEGIKYAAVSPKQPLVPGVFQGGACWRDWKFLVGREGFLVDPRPYLAVGPAQGYVQPLWGSRGALDKCLEIIRREPSKWRLSVQLHKYLDLP